MRWGIRETEVCVIVRASVHIFIKDDAKLRTRRICLWASYKVGEEPTQEGTVCLALLPASSFCCVVKRRCNRLLKEVRQSEVRSGLSVYHLKLENLSLIYEQYGRGRASYSMLGHVDARKFQGRYNMVI